MYNSVISGLLSIQDARLFFQHVVAEERHRIHVRQLITRMAPGGEPELDSHAMWATREALDFLSKHGINATLSEPQKQDLIALGRSETELRRLQLAISLLKEELAEQQQGGDLLNLFLNATGRTAIPSQIDQLAIQQLLLEGRSAAWSKTTSESSAPCEALLAPARVGEMENLMSAPGTLDLQIADGSHPPEEPKHQPKLNESRRITEITGLELPLALPTAVPPSSGITDASEPIFDPDIYAVLDRLVAHKSGNAVLESTKKQYRSFATLFIKITGIRDVRQIRPSHVALLRQTLDKLPKSWGKSPADRDTSIEAVLQRAKSLPPSKIGLAVGTFNRHLDHLGQILAWAAGEGIPISTGIDLSKYRRRETKRDRDKRASFTKEHLESVFRGSIWNGCKSSTRRNHPGSLIERDGLFWLPLVAAYSGARREEIASLTADEIREEGSILYFDIKRNENRDLKTLAASRKIPVHSRLIELGFIHHVAKTRKSGGGDLFPELRPNDHDYSLGTTYGDRIDYAWRKALQIQLDGNPLDYCFHSIRHYVKDRLDREGSVSKKVRYDILGHEGDDTHERVYGEASSLQELKAAIEMLPIVY